MKLRLREEQVVKQFVSDAKISPVPISPLPLLSRLVKG